jgi:hypothetical protein
MLAAGVEKGNAFGAKARPRVAETERDGAGFYLL